ncbi:hypothetical protein PPYR_08881 [Photinus pyralis]|uniref:Uncharacterized protein n=1 Tax=Photinus pyralis TaxID=7054 RepID=A0A1Y1NG02_PHOPY|nr:nucleolin-like [Photinus pyralis]XP_031350988.1 nucleolin-like [Photinus pyralis]KAB0794613.1 hypothetical protein PPYR_11452 [Photinus pyralis]KAB0797888.1 hypothetical protein PPYR_08881 [Photinus pyralis]
MADISKEDLRKEITAILKDADLATTSAKKVRQQLEKKLDANLLSRKKEIDTLVMEYVNSKDTGAKKKAKKSESDEEEEENEDDEEEEGDEDEEGSEDEKKDGKRAGGKKAAPAKRSKKASDSEASEPSDEGESEEEYSPKKSKPPKTRKLPPKKKKGSESDSDEDWAKTKKGAKKGGGAGGGGGAKRAGSGYTKSMTLSPELAALVGQSSMARHEVVKKIWEIIKERDLYDPKNKQFAICDDALFKVIGTKRFRTFGMMKYLKSHFIS